MILLNYTPHQINLIRNGKTMSIPPSGLARVSSSVEYTGDEILGVPIVRQRLGEVTGVA